MQAKTKIIKRIELDLDMDEDEALTLRHILEYGQTMIPHTGENPSHVINTILAALRNAKGDANEKHTCDCQSTKSTAKPYDPLNPYCPGPIDPLFD